MSSREIKEVGTPYFPSLFSSTTECIALQLAIQIGLTRARQEDGASLDYGDDIDRSTFEQILEMDDDEDDRDFSRSIVFGFFDQAEETFKKMDTAL